MAKKTRHVVPNPRGGWSVRQSGASRATKVFDTQAEAVKYGKRMAKKERTEVFVHRKDGTIRQRDSYRDSPSPSRKKR